MLQCFTLDKFLFSAGWSVWKSLLGRGGKLYWKETPTQMFSCKRCKTSTCFEEQQHTAASENIKKRFLGHATRHHDHYIIHTGGQRPKSGSNWPLTCPYLHCCWLWLSQSCSFELFISSDASICSTKAFPSLRNSSHVAVSDSIDFLSNSKQDAPFLA